MEKTLNVFVLRVGGSALAQLQKRTSTFSFGLLKYPNLQVKIA